MPNDADVIVMGSGAGGATLAYACARAGKSVLVLERGQAMTPTSTHDELAMLIDKTPYDDRAVDVNGTDKRLYMGGVVGGGTALYGAALLRPSPFDFHPGMPYGERLPREQWDWPISYEAMEPYYAEAETLFGVAGSADSDFGPLPRPSAYPNQPLPLHPVNERLMAAGQRHGLKPFRLPLAIDPVKCIRCNVCPGYVCPTGARRSSGQLLQEAPSERLSVLTGMDVAQITWNGAGEANGVTAVERATGKRVTYRASRYVLAAGAIGSPLVLLRSGIDHPLVGRNYMMHLSPIVVGFFLGCLGADEGFVKQVGYSDYYFGNTGYAHKLGLVQSLPVPGPLMLAKASSRWLPGFVLAMIRRRMLPLVGIIEDMPNPANRVSWLNGKPRLDHRFSDYDQVRGRYLAERMTAILKQAGAAVCMTSQFASAEHVAHQCGTLRFGVNSKDAVLDPDCRVFGHPNVFVTDGSFMPTSLGVGPALTIIANALRVASVVAREA